MKLISTGKEYLLRFNQSNPDSVYSFAALKNGRKKIETRAATGRHRKICVGDTLMFVCGKKKFKRTVRRVTTFKSIVALLQAYRVKDIMPNCVSKKELKEAYYSYHKYKEKIRKFGVVAFEV